MKEKIRYFIDYYLMYVVIGLLVLGVGIFLVVHFLHPPKEPDYYIAVLNKTVTDEERETISETVRGISSGRYEYIVVDDAFDMTGDGLDKLQVYLFNHRVNLILADRMEFERLAGYGYFVDLSTILSQEVLAEKEHFAYAAGFQDSGEISFEDNEVGKGAYAPYGILLSGSSLGTFSDMEDPILAVAVDSAGYDVSKALLETLIRK